MVEVYFDRTSLISSENYNIRFCYVCFVIRSDNLYTVKTGGMNNTLAALARECENCTSTDNVKYIYLKHITNGKKWPPSSKLTSDANT